MIENSRALKLALGRLRTVNRRIARSRRIHGQKRRSNRRERLQEQRRRLYARVSHLRMAAHKATTKVAKRSSSRNPLPLGGGGCQRCSSVGTDPRPRPTAPPASTRIAHTRLLLFPTYSKVFTSTQKFLLHPSQFHQSVDPAGQRWGVPLRQAQEASRFPGSPGYRSRLQAALRSRSSTWPQHSHLNVRSFNISSSFRAPHNLHNLLDGNH